MRLSDIPLSVLDLIPVLEGGTFAEGLRRSLDLARHSQKLGYHRFWLAEHHNMPGIGSAATAVLIGHIAGGTSKIRVGSGGVMLLNHAPLIVAEQFGTLESLYPGRIDLGLGRAPGTDQATMRALRQGLNATGDDFPMQLEELRTYLRHASPNQKVRAFPGMGTNVPIYLLGSGGFSARLAAQLGLPFASAGHFSPDNLLPGLDLYRRNFLPSATLQKPYAIVCVNIFAGDTDAEAERLATSQFRAHLMLARGMPVPLPPPSATLKHVYDGPEQLPFLRGSIIGSATTVQEKLNSLLHETQADELMIHSMIYDHEARKHSYEIVQQIAHSSVYRLAA